VTNEEALDPVEVERLRAERDALATEVEALRHHGTGRARLRRWGALFLVFLACLSFTAAVPAVWARRNFLDTERFVSRVGPLVEEPAVQEVLTLRLTEQLMLLIDPRSFFEEVLPEEGRLLALPLSGAVEGFVQDQVAAFIASDRFDALWNTTLRVAHEAASRLLSGDSEVVLAQDGQVTLNLIPIVNAVLAEITSLSPEILGREIDIPDITVEDIPAEAIARLERVLDRDLPEDFGQIAVYDDGKLEAAQIAVDLFNTSVFVLVAVALLAIVGALVVSTRRRRTLLQLCFGIFIGMALLRRGIFILNGQIRVLPPTDEGKDAIGVVVDAVFGTLLEFALWALAATGVVALVALVTGPYPWAVTARRRATDIGGRLVSATGEKAQDEGTVRWVAAHRDGLLAGGVGVGLLLLWSLELSWLGLLLVVALIGAYALAVMRTAASSPLTPP
jgi:hypothetical protein